MNPDILRAMTALFKRQQERLEGAFLPLFRRTDERLDQIERMIHEIAADVDELDRFNRPYGDGTKLPRERRW